MYIVSASEHVHTKKNNLNSIELTSIEMEFTHCDCEYCNVSYCFELVASPPSDCLSFTPQWGGGFSK